MDESGKNAAPEDSPARGEPGVRPGTAPLKDAEIPSVRAAQSARESAPPAAVRRPAKSRASDARRSPPGANPGEPSRGDADQPSEARPAAPAGAGAGRRRRRWPRYVLAVVIGLFLVTWIPVLLMRWFNPPTTAFMLETAAALESGRIHQDWVPYERISPAMRLAVVASEDQTFPYNHGFAIDAIQQAIQYNEQHQATRGASTITQQTAKNLFLWSGGGYFRKAIEAWFTVLIDLTWSKRRVLEVYLNIAQFGPRIFGVEAAAQHYFGKPASQLTASEAALLAATLPDPYAFDPAHPSGYLLRRRQWILEQMDNLGPHYLDQL